MSRNGTKQHSALRKLEFDDDVLTWGGRKVTELAVDAGTTPFYAYDKSQIAGRIEALRSALPNEISIHYAMKANPMPELVRYVAGLVDGLDVASAGEIEVAMSTDTNPRDISFAGPGKRNAELESAVSAGITVNAESVGEIRRLAQLSDALGNAANVALRINPSFELKTAGMKMGGRPSQFGIDAEAIPDAIDEVHRLGLHFRGFHVFSGAQNLNVQAITESLEQTPPSWSSHWVPRAPDRST